MRILLIHARYFEYRAREKALDSAEHISTENSSGEFSNVLVVFTTIEKGDSSGLHEIVSNVADDVARVLLNVGAGSVVLYPYAHLSKNLADPEESLLALRELELELKNRGMKVHRAPFGWYKEFKLECFGHPLSELSREFKAGELRRARPIEKKYVVLLPTGEIVDPKIYLEKGDDEELKILISKEVFKVELPGGEPEVSEACNKFGFEWEPMSDAGHMRYGPHATVMIEAVSSYAWDVVRSLGIPVFRVRGTNMFNTKFKPIKEHAELFGDRLYEVETDRGTHVLRYAACHQQFAMIKDWIISYRDLPFGVFEIADSYRYEQPGELQICFRLRKFLMPDLHIFTKDLREAVEFGRLVQRKIHEEIGKLERKYVALYNVTEDFFREHFDYLLDFVRGDGRAALVAILPSGIYYWVINVEYVIIDSLRKPAEIATFQIDVGNARRFGIAYSAEDGKESYPVIIHTAIIGSIERYVYAVMDTAVARKKRGQPPTIPTWLAPIQVRVIPVSQKYLDYANEVLKQLVSAGIRVDLDDRDISLAKKIREAGIEWIPYSVVVGEREYATKTVNVRIRVDNSQRVVKIEELVELVKKDLSSYPQAPQSTPFYLSRRPTLNYLSKL
ncbi:MAG: threonine--tRNA ligase [Sulfolobales archaeon]|nr:threonine--tRNA ligase [Sulfolobales archaeon]MDW8082346.1 threonine--tRNA ligase [Sulfolobales archaeon]